MALKYNVFCIIIFGKSSDTFYDLYHFQIKNMANKEKDFKKRADVHHLDFSPDGKCLAVGYE